MQPTTYTAVDDVATARTFVGAILLLDTRLLQLRTVFPDGQLVYGHLFHLVLQSQIKAFRQQAPEHKSHHSFASLYRGTWQNRGVCDDFETISSYPGRSSANPIGRDRNIISESN